MDPLGVFTIVWLAALMLLLALTAWWHWMTTEPRWFLIAASVILVGVIASLVLMLNGMPVWVGWGTLAVSSAASIVCGVILFRPDTAHRQG